MKTTFLAVVLFVAPCFGQALAIGPTIPLVQVTPGDAKPVSLAPGAGASAAVALFPGSLFGKPLHWLSLGGDVFGTLAPTSGELSIALHASLAEAVTVGVGLRALATNGTGALNGVLSSKSFFLLLGLDCRVLGLLGFGHADAWPAALEVAPVAAAPAVLNACEHVTCGAGLSCVAGECTAGGK